MHNKKRLFLSLAVLSVFMFSSCFKDTYNDQINQEKNDIAAYVNVNYPGTTPNVDGLYYIPHVIGTGDTVSAATDYVLITYNAKLLDGTLFDTTDTTVVLSGHYRSLKPGGPYTFPMASNFYGLVEGIANNGVAKMKEGGTATLIMPSTLAFGDFKPRIYDIKLLKVYHNIAATRKAEFDTTMVHLHFNLLKDSITGFMNLQNDTLKTPGVNFAQSGDTIAVRYTGWIMDSITNPQGRKFESIDTAIFIMGYSTPVFYKALAKIKVGWMKSVYIPFYNAFGAGNYIDTNTGQILAPPYSNVMYNIEFFGFASWDKVRKKWIVTAKK